MRQILNSIHEGDSFSANTLGKSRFHLLTDWSGRPVLTNGKRPWFPYDRYDRCDHCDRWEKKSLTIAAIIAIIWKPLSSDRSDNDRWDKTVLLYGWLCFRHAIGQFEGP